MKLHGNMREPDILSWLLERNASRLSELYSTADETRKKNVGEEVHLRGLIEISNFCSENCLYCGIRNENKAVVRYRMDENEILDSARVATGFGYGTVVLQAGEDAGIDAHWLADVVKKLKSGFDLAVTLSMGERHLDDLALWREAGADRYLLRFETSDLRLFNHIHATNCARHPRLEKLQQIKALGYETGSGVLVGVPGQTHESLARDICTFRELDLDMVGIGPFVPHPGTPLAAEFARQRSDSGFVANSEEMVYKVLALTRILCPQANIPSTTALATINSQAGRQNGLNRGANVIMPNVTPGSYRRLYEIYPAKASSTETAGQTNKAVLDMLNSISRPRGKGKGFRAGATEADRD